MRFVAGSDLAKATARSSLGTLPREVLTHLLEGAVMRDVSAGTTPHWGGDPAFLELVLTGLFRAYVVAPRGRTMTIRYCRPGALMGTGTVFNEDRVARGAVSAVVNSQVLALQPARVRDAARTDIRVTLALLRETSARVAEYINELQASGTASVRQRLARHLLDLASEQQRDGRLKVRVSQEALASAVGTVREIVARVLADMRAEGLVSTGRGVVELLDPARIDAETYRGY